MAAPDWMFDSTAEALDAVLPLFTRSPPVSSPAIYARYRRTLARLSADTRAATRSPTLGADLTVIVLGYREASGDLRMCIAGLERIIVATRAVAIAMPAITATEQLRQQHELALLGFIESLALAQIAECVARLDIASYDEARALRGRLGRLYDIGIERASERGAIDTAMAMRTTLGALMRDLIERGRPLARLSSYEIAIPLPAVVLAHELYQDAGRASELTDENANHDHPAFMPMTGRARSR